MVERKPCAQWSPPRPGRSPSSAAPCAPSSLDVQLIADQRSAISAFGVGLGQALPSRPLRRPTRGKCLARHRGAQSMGHTGQGPPSTSLYYIGSIPTVISSQSQVRFPFGRLWRPDAMRCACRREARCFIFASYTARRPVGTSVGIGNNLGRNLLQIQMVTELGDCRPGAPRKN